MSYMEMGGVFMMPMLLLGLVGLVLGLAALLGAGGGAVDGGAAHGVAAWKARAPLMADVTRHLAVLLFVMGLLSQAMGLYQALSIIESVGGQVSPGLVAGGVKVSFIAPMFGGIEFVVLYALYVAARWRMS